MELRKLEECLDKIVHEVQSIKDLNDFDRTNALELLKLIMIKDNTWLPELIKYCFDEVGKEYLNNKIKESIPNKEELHALEVEDLKHKLEEKLNIKIISVSDFYNNDYEEVEELRGKYVTIFNTGMDFTEEEIVAMDDIAYEIQKEGNYKTILGVMVL